MHNLSKDLSTGFKRLKIMLRFSEYDILVDLVCIGLLINFYVEK